MEALKGIDVILLFVVFVPFDLTFNIRHCLYLFLYFDTKFKPLSALFPTLIKNFWSFLPF